MKSVIRTTLFLIITTFLFQGFQCGSKEYTSAKTALKRGDSLKAIDYLKEELVKNPQNTEAKLLLTELTYKTAIVKVPGPEGRPVDKITSIAQLREAAKLSVDAANSTSAPKDKQFLQSLQQAIWVNSFNEGLKYFNKAESGSMSPEIDSAIALWDVGRIVRPRNLSFVNLQGNAYSKAKNVAKEEESNIEYMTLLIDDSREILERGIYLDYPQSDLTSSIGTPTKTYYDTVTRNADSQIRRTDIFDIDGQPTYIYSLQDGTDFLVKGWLYNAPDMYVGSDLSWQEINTSPLEVLTQAELDKENYSQAIDYLDKLLLFRPYDRQLNQLKIQSYVNDGQGQTAINELEALIAKDPSKKEYHLQMGDLYSELKNYDKAIQSYERAIELDPGFDYALRNLASVYKNKAAIAQEAEIDKQKADKNYKPDTAQYFPFLEKSGEYFQRAVDTETFQKDLGTIMELYNIYNVMGDTQKQQAALKNLESLESSIPTNQKLNYYYKLLKIYSTEKMSAEVNRITEKINELQGN
jgi:tetratricopeptide (TPR) repeat protein